LGLWCPATSMGVRLFPAVHGHIADSVRDHEAAWWRAHRPGHPALRGKLRCVTDIRAALAEHLRGHASPVLFVGSGTRSRSSRRRVPARRSQVAFMRGAWTAVRRIVAPAASKTASNEAVKLEPRSRIRNRKFSNRSSSVRARLRACWTVHALVGCAVTPPRLHPAGAVFDEHQYVQPFQQHCVNVEEVDGQDPRGLGVQELAPRRA